MDSIIELSNVTKSFNVFAVKNLSFQVKKGFVTGFVGANGAGKSTTIKLIMNLLQPDSGEVKIFGLDYQKHEKQIKENIGDLALYVPATLEDIMFYTKKGSEQHVAIS